MLREIGEQDEGGVIIKITFPFDEGTQDTPGSADLGGAPSPFSA